MNTLVKKSVVVIICLTFLISAVGSSTAVTIKSEESIDETSKESEAITVYRYGPDGSVTPIEINIELDDEQDLAEYITKKCEDLLEDDYEMQSFFNSLNEDDNSSGLKFGFWAKVTSKGKGFHFKTKLRLRFEFTKRLISLTLPRIKFKLTRSWIYCNYANDSKAKTTIKPILDANSTQIIEGNHSILLRNFVGITTWPGRFELLPNELLPRFVIGRAKFVICNKL